MCSKGLAKASPHDIATDTESFLVLRKSQTLANACNIREFRWSVACRVLCKFNTCIPAHPLSKDYAGKACKRTRMMFERA